MKICLVMICLIIFSGCGDQYTAIVCGEDFHASYECRILGRYNTVSDCIAVVRFAKENTLGADVQNPKYAVTYNGETLYTDDPTRWENLEGFEIHMINTGADVRYTTENCYTDSYTGKYLPNGQPARIRKVICGVSYLKSISGRFTEWLRFNDNKGVFVRWSDVGR